MVDVGHYAPAAQEITVFFGLRAKHERREQLQAAHTAVFAAFAAGVLGGEVPVPDRPLSASQRRLVTESWELGREAVKIDTDKLQREVSKVFDRKLGLG